MNQVTDPRAQVEALFVEVAPFIDGSRRDGVSAVDIINPAHSAMIVGRVHEASSALVDEAVKASKRALPAWAAMPLDDRIAALRAAAAAVAEVVATEQLALVLTREQGKILAESQMETGSVPFIVEQFASLARQALVEDRFDDERGTRIQIFVPIGPVAIVTPWNWPVSLSMLKIIPALLAGNTATLKPAPNTPLAITRMTETMAQYLPAGVLNVVPGGAEIGAALVGHPLIRKVVFTGSTASGRKVFAACAPGMRKMALELGGNDPAILLDDVDLNPATLQLMARSIYLTAGQVCWAIKRIYAPRSRYEEIIDAFIGLANNFVVGDGLDPSVTMGPVNNAVQLGIVRGMVAEAKAGGAHAIECGRFADELDPEAGFFHRPTIVRDIGDTARLACEEQFGPALPFLVYDDIDECIARANDTEYGLCASVWTADTDRGFAVARRMESGQAFVNCHAGPALDYSIPFGGTKQSGFGRELGVEGIREFTERQLLSNRLVR